MKEDSVVEISNLSFSYDAKDKVLHIPNFDLKKHEKGFLYGPSGYGKSTLLNLIAGVIPHHEGSLKVLGQDYSSLSSGAKNKLRGQRIGYIFQNFNLIPYLSVKENILLPARLFGRSQTWAQSLEECADLMETLKMTDSANKKPAQLSLGQQQRVAQARALLGRPELIIADEPTSSLDEQNTEEFMKLLISSCEKKNLSLLFVSHDLRLKEYFDSSVSLKEINEVQA